MSEPLILYESVAVFPARYCGMGFLVKTKEYLPVASGASIRFFPAHTTLSSSTLFSPGGHHSSASLPSLSMTR